MDHKTFKTDLTYACKKFAKEGKILSAWGDNLTIQDGVFVSEGEHLDALEMLVLIKGYTPTSLMTTVYHDKWVGPNDGVTYEYHTPHYTGFNLSMVDVLVEQAQIRREDLYSFMDGFDNIEPSVKSEFHTIGVYIREKFAPAGARTETLKLSTYEQNSITRGKTPERMFSIYTRRGDVSIVEAQAYVLTAQDDSSIMSLPEGEFKCLITAPELLFEKKMNGVIGPAIFCSHSVFRDYNYALREACSLIEKEFAFNLRKYKKEYTDADVAAAMLAIKLVKLPGSTFLTDAEKFKLQVEQLQLEET